MPHILVVENAPAYLQAARHYFIDQMGFGNPNSGISFAEDYESAMEGLKSPSMPTHVITDCFFPRLAQSEDISLGREVIERFVPYYPDEVEARRLFDYLKDDIDMHDPEIRFTLRRFAFYELRAGTDSTQAMLWESVKRASRFCGKDYTTRAVKDMLMQQYKDNDPFKGEKGGRKDDYFDALENGLAESPANQPLGVLVIEEANRSGIPVVLASSQWHHDALLGPVLDYLRRREMKFHCVDCHPESRTTKADPKFWEMAYSYFI